MKQFALGSAFLMFISSLPAAATREHVVRLEPQLQPQNIVYMRDYGNTLPPIGYVTFCRGHEAECQPETRVVDRLQLSSAKRRQLAEVNSYVNRTVKPVTDLENYGQLEVWAYPNGKGDCEDYVLLKRRMLIERGWPESTLLITVVRDENNEGHAVLTVRTDAGDFILDNKRADIVRWTDTPYTFIKQQSESNPLVWTSLLPTELNQQTTASHGQ
jgi:predicted transglutaminase-like cysteine proteinase